MIYGYGHVGSFSSFSKKFARLELTTKKVRVATTIACTQETFLSTQIVQHVFSA